MTHNILAIDDEEPNLLMLEAYLSGEKYALFSVQNALDGIKHLQSGHKVDAILLDRMMPGMDGIEFIRQIKQIKQSKNIPIIMQTAAASQDEIAEGIAEGVFYYLTKPYKKILLLSILENAIKDFALSDALKEQLSKTNGALNKLCECRFVFQTLEDVSNVSSYIAQLYPKSDVVIMGIKELMINAVEHGNLGITYDEKSDYNLRGIWLDEVSERLSRAENKNKIASISFLRKANEIELIIEDQGDGFEWEHYMEISSARAMHSHGRGIALSKMLSFDRIEYHAPGNKVVCRTIV